MLGKIRTEFVLACVIFLLRELNTTNVTTNVLSLNRTGKNYWGPGYMPPYAFTASGWGAYPGQGGWGFQGQAGWGSHGSGGWGGFQGSGGWRPGWGPQPGWPGEQYEEEGFYKYPHPWPPITDPAYHAFWAGAQERGACISKGAACDWTKRGTCCWPEENGCHHESNNLLSRYICKKSYTGTCVAKDGECSKLKATVVNVCCDPTNYKCSGSSILQWQWHCEHR